LSTAAGTLEISCIAGDHSAEITWRERGGPEVFPPVEHGGYGSKLVTNAVAGQLGGSIDFEWLSGGVVAVLRTSKVRLGA
jgi:two-component sensor histidine kinase